MHPPEPTLHSTRDPSIEHRFSAAAHTYDGFAAIQIDVAEQLSLRLPSPEKIHRVLEIGCGTGIFTQHLAAHYPHAEIHALDISANMIDEAKEKFSHQPIWHCDDYLRFTPEKPYDLICSSSTLHWLTPIEQVICRIQSHLTEQGTFIASLMMHDTFRELHELRTQLFPDKPVEQRLPCITELACALPDGYELEIEPFQQSIADPRTFFSAIKQLGVTGGAVSRTRLNAGETRKLIRAFTAPSITWQVGYIGPEFTRDTSDHETGNKS